MRNITISFVSLVSVLAALCLVADPAIFIETDSAVIHLSLVNITGVIAMGIVSVAMILAIRSTRINSLLGGLDKSYRLHKWLGIAGLVVAVIHWALVNFPKWFLGWEAIEPPPEQSNPILDFFQSQFAVASEVGDMDFKVFVILVVLALIRQFPYRYFFKTHRLLAIVYLLLVFHSVFLMDFEYWGKVIAPVMVILMAGGSYAAIISLFRRIGRNRRVVGVVDEINSIEQDTVLRVVINLKEKWPGHKEGQFAFVTFDKKEGPHPFTISSPWTDNGKIFFLIKGLGDYTASLRDKLEVGDYAEIEGPYGQFDFNSEKNAQIWVAGGIGIAPFVARLKALGKTDESRAKEIHLFYSVDKADETLIEKLEKSAKDAGIGLHVVVPSRDGKLDFDRICELVPQWKSADIWFCGPQGFGKALKNQAIAAGILAGDFHQELFEMR